MEYVSNNSDISAILKVTSGIEQMLDKLWGVVIENVYSPGIDIFNKLF